MVFSAIDTRKTKQLMNRACKLEDTEKSLCRGNSRCEHNVYVSF